MILDESRLTHHYVVEIFNNKGLHVYRQFQRP